jgi:ABC-2 type transport system ATP-binding protein
LLLTWCSTSQRWIQAGRRVTRHSGKTVTTSEDRRRILRRGQHLIQIDRISKGYGQKLAVADLSLRVERGEVFAFLGANGAGKTTTIKLLVGLLIPDSGSLRLGSFDVVKQPRDASRLVGYVPDQPYLYDKLTGREFLQFIAEIYGLTSDEAEESIDEQIDTFSLADFVDRMSETYSHGMKQRMVFAAALVHRPQVIILDEPMIGLDPHSMRVVKDLLRRQADRGTTVFMSTHTLSLAEEIADRIGVITTGQLKFIGSIAELRAQTHREGESLERLFLDITAAHAEAPP